MAIASKPYNRRDRWRRAAFIAILVVVLDACSPTTPPSSAPSAAAAASSSAASSLAASSGASAAATALSDPAGWTRYKGAGFSIAIPPGWKTDTAYDYSELGPGQDIHGVSFTIPAVLAKGTNLSSNSYIAVEILPGSKTCAASAFIDGPTAGPPVKQGGVTYSVATGSQGAAGNFYEETVYAAKAAAKGTSPCIAVRDFIHSTNIGNYDPGTIKAFDEPQLIAQFDAIRRTLVLDAVR